MFCVLWVMVHSLLVVERDRRNMNGNWCSCVICVICLGQPFIKAFEWESAYLMAFFSHILFPLPKYVFANNVLVVEKVEYEPDESGLMFHAKVKCLHGKQGFQFELFVFRYVFAENRCASLQLFGINFQIAVTTLTKADYQGAHERFRLALFVCEFVFDLCEYRFVFLFQIAQYFRQLVFERFEWWGSTLSSFPVT